MGALMMGALITFLTLMVFLFAGLGQTGSISPRIAYPIAGVLAVITLALAIVRYKQRKDRGE
jgi:hypothetical protein